MKQLLTVVFLLLGFCLMAQTGSQLGKVRSSGFSSHDVSAKNPWLVGAKLSFTVQDLDGSLANNFIFSGKAATILAEGEKFAFPLYSSVDLGSGDIFSSESGFNVGIYPYYLLSDNANYEIVLHGGSGYKIIPALEDGLDAESQFKVTMGIEAAFYKDENSLPTTVSIAPAYLWNSIFEDIAILEITGVVPISQGIGALIEYQQPFKDGIDGIFRIGVITVGLL